MINYYKTLGVENFAPVTDIKTAYRKLSKKFHPDMNDGDKFFEERFKEIQKAYEVLGNTYSRRTHDAVLKQRERDALGKQKNTPAGKGDKAKPIKEFSFLYPFNFFVFILALIALIILFRYRANNGPW